MTRVALAGLSKTTTTSASALATAPVGPSLVEDAYGALAASFEQFCLMAGIESLTQMMNEDVARLAGDRYEHCPDKPGYRCAMYLNGAPFRGPQGAGGELGHTIVDLDGRQCTCGRRGCWETVATLSWLRGRTKELGLPDSEDLDVEKLVVQSEISPEAKQLLIEYAHNLSIGISNLQTLMMLDNLNQTGFTGEV